MAQLVQVPGIGQLSFPDGMSQQDMAAAIYKNFPQLRPQATATAPAAAPRLPEDFDPQADEAETLASKAMLSGIGEGARRAWSGIKQLGADLSDAYHNIVPQVDPTTGKRIMPTAGQDVTAQENARRRQALQQAQQQFGPALSQGQQYIAGGTEAVLNAAPWIAGEGALGPAVRYGINIARQGLLGAGAAAAAFSPTDTKGQDALLGGLFGAGMGALNPVAMWNAAWNKVARIFSRYGKPSEAAYQAAKDVMGWGTAEAANAEPTLAMRTGIPRVRTLEAAGFDSNLQERYANIRDAYLSQFKKAFELPQESVVSPSIDDAYKSALAGANASIDKIQQAASKEYEAGMQDAVLLAGRTGNPRLATVPVPELRSELNGIIGAQTENLVDRTDTNLEPVNKLRTVIDAQSGRLSVQDIATKLVSWSKLLRNSRNDVEKAVVGRAVDALYNDIGAYLQSGHASAPALQKVLETRAAYRQAKESIEALQQTAAYRFLGVTSPQELSPDNLLSRFASFAPTKQQAVASWLKDNAPNLYSSLRQQAVQEAVDAATARLTPASNSTVDIAQLLGSVYNRDTGVLRHYGLWTPQERQNMEKFRQAARVILNVAPHEASGAGTIIGPAEIAPNLVSLSPIFGARQIARWLGSKLASKSFADPELYDSIMRVRSTSGPAQSYARAALAQKIASLHEEDNGSSSATP